MHRGDTFRYLGLGELVLLMTASIIRSHWENMIQSRDYIVHIVLYMDMCYNIHYYMKNYIYTIIQSAKKYQESPANKRMLKQIDSDNKRGVSSNRSRPTFPHVAFLPTTHTTFMTGWSVLKIGLIHFFFVFFLHSEVSFKFYYFFINNF